MVRFFSDTEFLAKKSLAQCARLKSYARANRGFSQREASFDLSEKAFREKATPKDGRGFKKFQQK